MMVRVWLISLVVIPMRYLFLFVVLTECSTFNHLLMLQSILAIFTARRYASTVYAVVLNSRW